MLPEFLSSICKKHDYVETCLFTQHTHWCALSLKSGTIMDQFSTPNSFLNKYTIMQLCAQRRGIFDSIGCPDGSHIKCRLRVAPLICVLLVEYSYWVCVPCQYL